MLGHGGTSNALPFAACLVSLDLTLICNSINPLPSLLLCVQGRHLFTADESGQVLLFALHRTAPSLSGLLMGLGGDDDDGSGDRRVWALDGPVRAVGRVDSRVVQMDVCGAAPLMVSAEKSGEKSGGIEDSAAAAATKASANGGERLLVSSATRVVVFDLTKPAEPPKQVWLRAPVYVYVVQIVPLLWRIIIISRSVRSSLLIVDSLLFLGLSVRRSARPCARAVSASALTRALAGGACWPRDRASACGSRTPPPPRCSRRSNLALRRRRPRCAPSRTWTSAVSVIKKMILAASACAVPLPYIRCLLNQPRQSFIVS